MRHALAAATLALCATAAAAQASADAARGRQLYESRCIACHSIDASRVGPAHRGVVGRKAGSVADYDYSPAVKASVVIWRARTLDRWLADPEKTIPGQKMNYTVPEARDRTDLIAWLAQNPR
jgi:cytochrome c